MTYLDIPEEATQAAEAALIAHSVEDRMPGICCHQAPVAVEAASPILMRAALEAVISRIDIGVPLMVNKKYRDGALWVQSQIEDLLLPEVGVVQEWDPRATEARP